MFMLARHRGIRLVSSLATAAAGGTTDAHVMDRFHVTGGENYGDLIKYNLIILSVELTSHTLVLYSTFTIFFILCTPSVSKLRCF